ncbi:hypothetical protein BC831DRAFT_482521 [Entophlyctis helioformis]|nr:hypothetical protein BC831DRAFT_482521 [Entophlyctis helioformis]
MWVSSSNKLTAFILLPAHCPFTISAAHSKALFLFCLQQPATAGHWHLETGCSVNGRQCLALLADPCPGRVAAAAPKAMPACVSRPAALRT